MIVSAAARIQSVEEYYFARKLRQVAQMNQDGGLPVLNLGIGSPDLPPHPSVVQALAEEAQKPNTHGYQSYRGIPELRQAYSNWYQKYYGVALNPDTEIMPLMGSKEGIMHISMAYLNEGDEVLIPNPGYPTYEAVTKIAGGKPRYYNLDESNGWLPNLEELGRQDLSKVKLCWVNYPQMPTGATAPWDFMQKLVAFAQEHQILLCHDNPYSFILTEQRQSLLQVPNALEVALELNSLSKSHNMAGWRMGMLAGSQERLNEIAKFKTNMDSGMFLPVQKAAIAALQLDEEWFTHINAQYAERRKWAWRLMDILEASYDPNTVGMFVWGKIPQHWKSAEELTEKVLHKNRVFLTPGHIFGSQGERYIRISLCSPVELLKEAFNRIIG